MNCLTRSIIILCLLQLYPLIAATQGYPTKPLRLVVPYPPGGGVDIMARALSERLARAWGQAVVVDNKPGGGTIIGAEIVARAMADGYTLLLTADTTITSNPHAYAKLPYDPIGDFAPITMLVRTPQIVVVHPSIAANTLQELAVLARSKPDEINYGSFGVGSPQHLAFENFKTQTGTKLTHVPYKGFAPVILAMITGEVKVTMTSVTLTRPYIQAGKVKALAIGRAERDATMPDVPTLHESGFPGIDPQNWFGLFAPTGTQRSTVLKIQADVAAVFAEPGFREQHVLSKGYSSAPVSPEEFAAFIQSDLAYKATMIKRAGIRPE
ncbi:MAG: tripartite tricarboxylate transporter substrate binding protein [Betaproteobacteria bacterium]|nr:tripartite tricarboxylate transporter substrate binding protein [Betaproteobacteria bacterium]